jgi:hypothetical protein
MLIRCQLLPAATIHFLAKIDPKQIENNGGRFWRSTSARRRSCAPETIVSGSRARSIYVKAGGRGTHYVFLCDRSVDVNSRRQTCTSLKNQFQSLLTSSDNRFLFSGLLISGIQGSSTRELPSLGGRGSLLQVTVSSFGQKSNP